MSVFTVSNDVLIVGWGQIEEILHRQQFTTQFTLYNDYIYYVKMSIFAL